MTRVYLDGAWRPRHRHPRDVLARRIHARTRPSRWRWSPAGRAA